MKIAYISLYFDKHHDSGGVGEKVRSQVSAWRQEEHQVALFFLTPHELTSEDISYFQYKAGKQTNFFSRRRSRKTALEKLILAVKDFSPDIIYLRHGLYISSAYNLFSIAPVVLEINSDDVQEYSLQNIGVRIYNFLTRRIFLRHSAGIISVTHELASVSYNKVGDKPIRVISNGVDLSQYQPVSAPKHNIPVLTIVGSPGMVWHGVDKLVQVGKMHPDMQINIVGYYVDEIEGTVPSNVRCWGFLPREEVHNLLIDTDVACGTLALHRKNMKEASPLKVREAAAYGIPLILGYYDTDLSELKTDTILQIPNTEDNVKACAAQIHDFAYRMMGRRLDAEMIQDRISHQEKEKSRLAFFEEILLQKREEQ